LLKRIVIEQLVKKLVIDCKKKLLYLEPECNLSVKSFTEEDFKIDLVVVD